MTTPLRPGTTAGAATLAYPRPTRREIESLLRWAFPGLSSSAANRSARRSLSAGDPYSAAIADIRGRISAGEFYDSLGYADPTGNKAVALVLREHGRGRLS